MNKQERIKNLTWAYFLQQKFKEIIWFVLIAIAIVLVPFIVGDYIDGRENFDIYESGDEPPSFVKWIFGFAIILGIGVFGYLIIAVGYTWISEWIESNWEKAKSRAIKEVGRKK